MISVVSKPTSLYINTLLMYNKGMNIKYTSPQLDKIRDVLVRQNGTLLTADLARLGIPAAYLTLLEQRGEIERVTRGVYRSPDALEDEFFGFQAVYKLAIYSHETALFLQDLTDRTPLFYWITLPTGYHSVVLKQSQHKIFFVSRALSNLGVITMPSPHGNPVRVTGLERTICDVVRSRNQMDIQIVYDALKRYVHRQDRDLDHLYSLASRFSVQKIVREYIEVLG